MEWRRHSSAVLSLALLASVVGHYALHRQSEARFQSLMTALLPDPHTGPLLLPSFPDDGPSAIPRVLEDRERMKSFGRVLPALQEREETDAESAQARPQPVPAPYEATPLSKAPETTDASPNEPSAIVDDNAVRRVIDEELLGSSREERDIWYDELKSIPAGVVRDLLQVRKQLRSLPRALHKADVPVSLSPRVTIRATEVSSEPASQTRRQSLSDWTTTQVALEQAVALSRHNVINSITPGFKRVRWHLVDSYSSDGSEQARIEDSLKDASQSGKPFPIRGDGCRLATPLLDLKQGILTETARPLDLAIDGDGFFVAAMNDKQVFSRCGAVTLDTKRQLCLTLVEGSAVLQPPVVIPEDALEIQISAGGEVHVLRMADAETQSVGRLHLARFASPERLRPIGTTLLVATEASGSADIGDPDVGGRGAIQQGCLEQSNVDIEVELADIERVQTLLQSLPMMARPVTASGDVPASR